MTKELLPITLEDAKEDFKKLDDLTCQTLKKMPPKSKVGNDAVDFFTYQERLNTKGNKHISFFDLYTNKNFYMEKTYVKNILAYLKKNSPNKSDLQIWRSIMGLYFGMPHIFKPLVAMEFYCRFKPTAVLDFTMGWGGRLLGACALDVPHYIGIDMNDKLRQPYEQMVKMVKPMTDTKITLMFKDALTVDYSKLDYDMVFTSPPYYNIELYNKTAQQSKDEWDANFYDPIIRKTFAGLKMGGHYCLNIPAEVYERVALKILGGADIKVPLNKTQRQAVAFKGGTAYTEFVYIWKKKGEIKGEGITTYKDKFNKKYGFEKDQSHSVADIAKITGYKKDGLETIFDKGVGAYHTNPQSVRPQVKSPEQWAMARIYSVIMDGKAKKIDASHLVKGEGIADEQKHVAYKPLPKPRWKNEWVIAKKSPIADRGVFAKKDIPKGTVIAPFYGKEILWSDFKKKYGEYKYNSFYTYTKKRAGKMIVAKEEPYLTMNVVNYINELPSGANAELDKEHLVASRLIREGEELSLKYPKDYNRYWLKK